MDPLDGNAFIGRGWAFPIAASATGGIAMVKGAEEIEQAIYLILSTTPGERPMRPEFGCGLIDFVFSPMEPATFGEIAFRVEEALDRWEPRVNVLDVDVKVHPDTTAMLLIDLTYELRDSYDRRSLVFPFYVIPRHEEQLT
ncbi:MAG: GPW/gp25 family protein [Actinomycetota bacterium]